MHAASVHPEPGSNSLKIYYIRFRVIYILELYSSFFYFLSFSQCVLTRFLYTILCSKFCCSIFKDRCANKLPCSRLFYYTIHIPFCQDFFKTFLSFFQLFSKESVYYMHQRAFSPLLLGCSISIPLRKGLVKGFFRFFSKKFVFRHTVAHIQKTQALYVQNSQIPSVFNIRDRKSVV